MKRIITLCLALCMAMGALGQAQAIELKATGQMDFVFGFTDNRDMIKDQDEYDHFFARQRARIAMEFIASENLKGVLQMQFGGSAFGDRNLEWGRNGAALDANDRAASIRRAYLDWNVANTGLNLKVGIQHLALPSFTFGNPVFGANVAGIVASGCVVEEVTLLGFWARPFHEDSPVTGHKYNQADLFGAAAIFDYDSFKIAPWFTYGRIGTASGFWGYNGFVDEITANGLAISKFGTGDLYVGGVAFEFFPIEQLGVHVDGMYGYLDSDTQVSGSRNVKSRGWLVSLLVDYKTDWGTPGLIGWYASGDDDSDVTDNKFGRLPVMGIDDGFTPTRLAFPGAVSWGDDGAISDSGVGTWGAGLQLADLSFAQDLSHTLRVVYMQGTNNKKVASRYRVMGESIYMTTDDWLIEFGIDSEYKFNSNLAAYLELGYLMVDFSRATTNQAKDEDMINAQLTLRYSF